MRAESIQPTEGRRVLFLSMPYASPANLKHIKNLIECLAPLCRDLFVVGDGRLDLRGLPSHVVRWGQLPTLHYVRSKRPRLWSALLWILKLTWIVMRSSWAVFETRQQVDVVVSMLGAYSTLILLLARLLGKKTIVFWLNSDASLIRIAYPDNLASQCLAFAVRLLESFNRNLADICAVESLSLTQTLQLETCDYKVRLGNNYLDTDFYRVLIPLADRPLAVGFLGRLSPGKGIMELLAAAALLHESGIAFRIVGDGPLVGEVEAMLQRPELSHVELTGWADPDTIVRSLNGIRLLVLATESEGLPDVVLEGLACGVPVLATAVGAIPDVILHNVTGFVLPDRDPATIAHYIRDALNHPDLAAVAERGRQLVIRNYSLPAVSNKWRVILEELAARPARDRVLTV